MAKMGNKITTRTKSNFLIMMAGLWGMVFFQPSLAGDFSVKPYAYSKISSSDTVKDADYLVLISAPKRVNNQLRIEKELRVDVEGVKETFRINDGHTTEQAFNHYFSQLKQLGGHVIYQCASRDCGRSSSWSEDVYRNSKLYGKDASQFYLSSAVQVNGEQWLVSLYTVERGNRRVFAHIETLKLNAPVSGGIISDKFGKKQNVFVFGYEVSGVIEINPNMAEINKIVDLSEATPETTVYVVGHLSQGYSTTREAIDQSKSAAEQLAALLSKRGIDSNKLSVVGVGPLVPVNQGDRSGNRVEVLVMDK